jgi:DNA-binding MarR family transcriptional regulator
LQDEAYVDQAMQAWVRVMRFERELCEALRAHGLSFPLYRVLEATDRSVRARGDAVSPQDVEQAATLGNSSLCSLLRTLERRGLVDIAFDQSGFAQRILLTAAGEASLAGARRAVLLAAHDAGLPRHQI